MLRIVGQLVASLVPALAAAPRLTGSPRTKGLALASQRAHDRQRGSRQASPRQAGQQTATAARAGASALTVVGKVARAVPVPRWTPKTGH